MIHWCDASPSLDWQSHWWDKYAHMTPGMINRYDLSTFRHSGRSTTSHFNSILHFPLMENLDLIDWKMVGFASLWIVGLAIELSVLGFVDYHAKVRGERRLDLLRQPGYQIWVNFGLVLFCLGVFGSSKTWWEGVIWAVLAIAFGYYSVQAYRAHRKES